MTLNALIKDPIQNRLNGRIIIFYDCLVLIDIQGKESGGPKEQSLKASGIIAVDQ